jgi:PAS domain S-box-containing protein
MSAWISTQMDYIYVGYGLVFFFLAIVAWSLQRQNAGTPRWGWLALFGVIHGANLWLEGLMFGLQWPPGTVLRLLLRLVSFLCLLEFGRASLVAAGRRGPGLWLHLVPLAVVASIAGSSMSTLQAVVRYAVGLPAGVLATWALVRYAATTAGGRPRRQLIAAAFCFAVYTLLVGLIPAAAAWPPASFLNETQLVWLSGLPAQVWRGLCVFVAAILLWGQYRRGQEEALAHTGPLVWWHYLRYSLPAIATLLLLGWVVTDQLGRQEGDRLREDLLWRARMLASALDVDHLARLSGTRADLASPDYRVIKAQLMALRREDDRARFYYVAGINSSNELYFFADSEPPGSKNISLPGDIYREATETFRSVLRTGLPAAEGPLPDRWGRWISVLAPLGPVQGGVRALVGLDMTVDDWATRIAGRRVWPILTQMLLMLMIISAFIVVQRLQMLTDWLKQSEQRYRGLIEGNASVMLLLNPDTGCVEAANPAASAFYGYPQDQWAGMRVSDFSLLTGAQHADLKRKLEHGAITYRSRHRLCDGRERDVEVALSSLTVHGARRSFAIVRDITTQVQAERELQTNETRLRNIYDSMTAHMLIGELVCDAAGRAVNYGVVDCNASFLRLLGRTREEVAGQLATQVFGGVPPFLERAAGVVAGGQPQHFEGFLASVGVQLDVALFTPEPGRFALFATDITAQKYGEEQLRLQGAALSAAANGIVITDRAGKIIWTNPAFSAMSGYELREVQGKTLDFLRSGQHPPEFYAPLIAAFRDGTVWSGELINRRKDGRLFTDATTVTPVRNSVGEVTHFIEIKQDVTEQRALQQQYLQAQKMESIGRLAAGIAHDFNNQLQGILGFSDLLRRTMPEGDERRSDIEEIRKAAYAAANLTRQLMAFGRRQALEMQVLDLNRLIADGHKMYQRLFGEDIAFALELAPDLERVKADPGQLDQVLMNLLINARDAMPRGGRVTISTHNAKLEARDVGQWPDMRPGRFVVLAVADTGQGIPPEVIEHIFEPFFTTKAKHVGTGLGLATVYGLAQQHGGWVHVYSEVGSGSTFKVYLPALVSAEPTAVVAGPVVSEQLLAGSGQRILLVEDEPGVRELALRILRQNNYTVTAAATVGDALKLHAEAAEAFDLLLSDVVLPDGNGLDLVEQLLARQPGLRVVMASGYTDERSRWPAIQARGLRFIPKPYPVATLLRTLHEVLQAPPQKA